MARKKRERPAFASEADLCAAFSEEMVSQGWEVYAETDGWDVLLVGHGMQVGVEAKLRPSIGVLAQLSERLDGRGRGPSYAVLLVPYATREFETLAGALGAIVYCQRLATYRGRNGRISEWVWTVRPPGRHRQRSLLAGLDYAVPLHFAKPAWIPPVAPDGAAGRPAPVRLTPWKVSALRLLARLELRGYVTVEDFREIGLHPSRWYHFWLIPEGSDRPQRWVRKPRTALADAQHPAAFRTMLERERDILDAKPPVPVQIEFQPLPLFDIERERPAQP